MNLSESNRTVASLGATILCLCVCLGRAHGADDFLPVMMYVLARSNLSNLRLDVEYMMELMDPSLSLGEGTDTHTQFYSDLTDV